MEPLLPSAPYTAHAAAGRRLAAFAVDALIAGGLPLIVSGVFAVAGPQARLLGFGLALLGGAAYVLLRDGLAHPLADGRSVGKRGQRLRPLRLDGGAMDPRTSARRNWTLALGPAALGLSYLCDGLTLYALAQWFVALGWVAGLLAVAEAALVAVGDGRRLGDRLAGTQVVSEG